MTCKRSAHLQQAFAPNGLELNGDSEVVRELKLPQRIEDNWGERSR